MSEVETLVVGAGPTGLAAACELRRHDREVHVVEVRFTGRCHTSRPSKTLTELLRPR